MLLELAQFEEYWGPLRLFRYLSFRCVMAAATSFIIGMLAAPFIINYLRSKKLAANTQRTKEQVGALADLHEWKKNTPILGGIIIFVAFVLSTVMWANLNALVVVALIVYIMLSALGFADDYSKMFKKKRGISGKLKLAVQLSTGIIAGSILFYSPTYSSYMLELYAPFVKEPLIAARPIFVAFAFICLIITASSNAINLTDGVDGLATGCTVSVILAYGVFSYVTGNAVASEYLFIKMIPGCGELAVVCCALMGACVAFLWYNAYPAFIWMGDTGSLALGGLVGVIAFMVNQPFTLILVGGVFVMEALSVILQVASFKTTGKRIFRMSPIHHHFELKGWKETQVVIRFWIISLIFSLSGLATLKLR